MRRRGTAALLVVVASTLAAGCRPSTVDLGFRPEPGARYVYRYEIDAVVTRAVAGTLLEVTEIDSELLVEQVVQEGTDDGARVEVELRRDGGAPRSAVVLLDRAGSLQGIELVEGLPGGALDGTEPGSVLGAPSLAIPERPLAPGERWTASDSTRGVSGRLLRLGVIDGAEVAVVRAELTEQVEDAVDAAGGVVLSGPRSSTSTTSYDLDDGAVRRSVSRARADLVARIEPPEGVDAEPVDASISYVVRVRVTRLAG